MGFLLFLSGEVSIYLFVLSYFPHAQTPAQYLAQCWHQDFVEQGN